MRESISFVFLYVSLENTKTFLQDLKSSTGYLYTRMRLRITCIYSFNLYQFFFLKQKLLIYFRLSDLIQLIELSAFFCLHLANYFLILLIESATKFLSDLKQEHLPYSSRRKDVSSRIRSNTLRIICND